MSWFRQRRPSLPASSLTGPWKCTGCDEWHTGLMDLAAFAPDPWPHDETREPNNALRFDGDFLSEDFCVIGGKHFLVRAVLEIPVHGLAEKFGFGCWTTLSEANFDTYLDGFNHSDYADWGPWPGWLCNQLETFIGTDPEAVFVYPQPDRQRPTLLIQDEQHSLAVAQREGIAQERVVEILRHYGHGPAAD
jgi:hypothetical protein